MAKVKQTVTRTIKTRVNKNVGTHPCPSCHGTGRKLNVGRGAKG